jgi:uncharacterized damage-inducible protein DinB
MPTSDPLQILLAHDRWATKQIFDTCDKLTAEQFDQRFPIGPGSLRDTTTHILGAMRVWTRLLAAVDIGQRIEQDGQRRSPKELSVLLETVADDLAAEAHRLPLDQTVTRIRDGKTFNFTRCAVLVHVTTHGMHHRAQCLNMLRQLGVNPLPRSSVAEWTWLAD